MGFEHNDIAIMGGLRAALEEETPMFERNDIVTAYKMNEAIAEGGGGGGGDFTTVKATITNNSSAKIDIVLPFLLTGPGGETLFLPFAPIDPGTDVLDALVYKGTGTGYVDTNRYSGTVTVSGDAEYNGGYIDFTGDFSLTYESE